MICFICSLLILVRGDCAKAAVDFELLQKDGFLNSCKLSWFVLKLGRSYRRVQEHDMKISLNKLQAISRDATHVGTTDCSLA